MKTIRVKYRNVIFTRYPSCRAYTRRLYYWGRVYGKQIHLHRWVYEHHFGPIPEGYDIHHKDGDHENNEPENLECIPHGEHLRRHYDDLAYMQAHCERVKRLYDDPARRRAQSEKVKKRWKDPAYRKQVSDTLTRYWSDPARREEHGAKVRKAHAESPLITKICPVCGSEFESTVIYPRKYCSVKCQNRMNYKRRRQK